MTQSTILPVGVTAATSSDIVIPLGSFVTVGVFTNSTLDAPSGSVFTILQDSPGADIEVATLSAGKSIQILGPGTFRVRRTASTGKPFGVFKEV